MFFITISRANSKDIYLSHRALCHNIIIITLLHPFTSSRILALTLGSRGIAFDLELCTEWNQNKPPWVASTVATASGMYVAAS